MSVVSSMRLIELTDLLSLSGLNLLPGLISPISLVDLRKYYSGNYYLSQVGELDIDVGNCGRGFVIRRRAESKYCSN